MYLASRSINTQRENQAKTQGEDTAINKPRKETSEEASLLASQSQTSDLQKYENRNFCDLSQQVWVLITKAFKNC